MQLAPPTTSSIGKTLYFLVFYVSATAAVRLGNMTRGKEIFSLRDFGNFDAIKARTQRRPFLIITENKKKIILPTQCHYLKKITSCMKQK